LLARKIEKLKSKWSTVLASIGKQIMYEVWMKLGLVVDVGHISSSNMDAKVQFIIEQAEHLSSTAEFVRSTIQQHAGFFNDYQIDLVGHLGRTSTLPASEFQSESDRDWRSTLLDEVEGTSFQDSCGNHSENDRDWRSTLFDEAEGTNSQDSWGYTGMVLEDHSDGTGIVAREVHSNFDPSVSFSSSFPNYIKFDTATLENYFVFVQVNNPSRLWHHNLPMLSDSEKKSILDDYSNGHSRVFTTCLTVFANLLQHCCAEFYSDENSIGDTMIHYPQGVSGSLEELCRSRKRMQDFLFQLRGDDGVGSAMCFQYGKRKCTPNGWATRDMKWKLVLPVALVKPLLAAAAYSTKRKPGFCFRNASAHYYLEIPSGCGNSTQDDQGPSVKRSKPNGKIEWGRTETQLCLIPHTYSHDFNHRPGMHLVDYACTMQELYDNAGMSEAWWQNSFWNQLVGSSSCETIYQ
jgi:hypothetical protein